MVAKKKKRGTLTQAQIGREYEKVKKAEKLELVFWAKKIKVLRPKKGDILIVPAEAQFDFHLLSEALKVTPITYALVVPGGNAKLMSKEDALKFAKSILKKKGKD